MFILLVDYKKPLEEVEKHLAEHRAFLDRHYAAGTLVCSGPQHPRTGGVIVCRAADRAAAEMLVAEDPFHVYGIADYTIIEFTATKHLPGFENFCG